MSDGPSAALLTGTHRDYLVGDGKERQSGQERALRSRLRRRIYRGLLDGVLIWQHLDSDERRKIFDAWKDAGEEIEWVDEGAWKGELTEYDRQAQRELNRFKRSLVSLIAFIYLGAAESDGYDADALITDAVATAEQARGNFIHAELSKTERFDVEALMHRFEERDPSLTAQELSHLRNEGEITVNERNQYMEDVRTQERDARPPERRVTEGGFVGEEGAREMLEDAGVDLDAEDVDDTED